MRKLAGEDQVEAVKEVNPEVKSDGKWAPYKGPDSLEKAKYKVKERHFKDHDGTIKTIKETVLEREGAPAYLVYGSDLLERRMGYGGMKQRLITTFKLKFPDTPIGRAKKKQQASFRAMLRSKGVPGA